MLLLIAIPCTLDAIVVKLQLVKAGINCPNCSGNVKMCVAGEPRRSEDAVQDIFHKVASF